MAYDWMKAAYDEAFESYGINLSVPRKAKQLIKWGKKVDLGTTSATVWSCPAVDETYREDNLITHVVSSAAGDNQVVAVEGHTLAGGLLTFQSQFVTLTGLTPVALGTPLARANRAYGFESARGDVFEGTVSIMVGTAVTAGVPDVASDVHLNIIAGGKQSFKGASSISSTDAYIVTGMRCDVAKNKVANVDFTLEYAAVGKAFLPFPTLGGASSHAGIDDIRPYRIIPPNHDFRFVAEASAIDVSVNAVIFGVLALVD